ncbi:ThiF family adenylyltransferase [Limnohabitans sp. Rim11]|uniref:tRNA threonylcarbamoyladenosine dehydratase n=1 Tax=Limnohabitans sp. Rim11 TaxID=1100719 RepID=UPI000A67D5F9|nr:tRNA threonylcarbamoyladenosine dehydratase [Limnohabitans sp. Rim11]
MMQARRFGGMDRLYGVVGAANIAKAHVLIVGIGGVGSWVAESLARSGVGEISLVDMDHVAESNINRQIHALESTLGMAKVTAMKERISQINPQCLVHTVDDFVTPENWIALIQDLQASPTTRSPLSAVIDACDQVKSKVAMADWAIRQKKFFVTLGAAGGKRQAHLVEQADLSKVTHDPLLAQVRYRLRKERSAPKDGAKMGVLCVFSRENVAPPDPSCQIEGDGSLNCHGYGSVVTVTASFGMVASSLTLNFLAEGLIKSKI